MMKVSVLMLMMVVSLVAGPDTAQQAPMLSVRTMALQAGVLPEIHMAGEHGYLPVTFSASQPGQTLSVRAANPLPLYQSQMDADGNPSWVVYQRVGIPAGAREILLLGWASGEGARYLAIEDNFSRARFNDWLLINASTRAVAFAAGEHARPVAIRAGASATHRLQLRGDEGVAVRAYLSVDEKPTVFYSTYWPVRREHRTVILFADDGDRVLVRRIADRLAMP